MAVPKKKRSVSRKRMRYAHSRLAQPGLSTCKNCKAYKRPHHVCASCGHYNGRLVIAQKVRESEDLSQPAV